MSERWRTVRVFISSTFRDMHAERDHLIKVVFPALRERLEKHRVYLIDIDLRWGVTRAQAENDQVLDLCLQQIDECRPFFIGILGERYGWVPTHYPADALKHFGWIQHHTGKSVTELEILHGVLQDSKMRGRAFFYFRDPVAVHGVPEALRRNVYVDMAPESVRKLEDLKRQIRRSGYPVMNDYPARWDAEANDRPSRSKGRLVGLEAFGERVHDQLWQAIQEAFQLPEQPPAVTAADPLTEEQEYHERFMDSRLRVYVGRESINDALLAFADGNDRVPCLVTGTSGSGKSAALARFVRAYEQTHPRTLVMPHFIGASPRSTNLRDMLRRFCQVLKVRFGFGEEVPEEVSKLAASFRELIGKVPTDARVLLVIDALNQLDEAERAQELYWLPTALPPHVKVIGSCIIEPGKAGPTLEAFRRRKHCPVHLAALSAAEQREIIRQVPSLSAKTLDDEQVRLLLSNPATANPLFLLVALEELRGFASYERLNERIVGLPREGDTVTAVFAQVIDRLTEEFNRNLSESVLTLLASARRGLSERELQELVAGLDGAEDLFPVLRQLRPYLLSRTGLVDFYHRNLFKAVRERYLASEEQQRLAHARLAAYFGGQDYWLESLEEQRQRATTLPPTARPANVRKVDELPWQLLQANDWQASEELLSDPPFLEAKAEAGMVFDLAADFSAALEGISAVRPPARNLRLLEEALRRDIHFIARHPTTLFQCFWNSCWWYDCPEAARHYVEAKAPGQNAGLDLYRLLEAWRAAKEHGVPGFFWLRSLRPPKVPLGTAQNAVFRGHTAQVASVAASADGRRIASGSWDHTVRLWDRITSQELLCFQGHRLEVFCVAFSPDGNRVASGSRDGKVRIVDIATGDEILCLDWRQGQVHGVAFSPDGRSIATASWEDLRIWNADTGAELCRCQPAVRPAPLGAESRDVIFRCDGYWGHDVLAVAFTRDGERIISGSGDTTVRVWDSASGAELLCLRGHTAKVTSIALSDERGRLASGSMDGTIRVWNVDTGIDLLCLTGHNGGVTSVAFSPDGCRIVSGSTDGTIRIWDAATGEQSFCLQAGGSGVASVAFLLHGQQIVSGLNDGTVRLWEFIPDASNFLLPEQDGYVHSVLFSPDGLRSVTGSTDGTVRIWDAGTAGELLRLRTSLGIASVLGFSSDGQQVIIGADDTMYVFHVPTGAELFRLQGHSSSVTCATFSADNKWIVSASWDNTVRLWEASTPAEFLCLDAYEETRSECCIHTLAFSRDGTQIMGRSDVGTLWVWDATTGEHLDVAEEDLAEDELILGKISSPMHFLPAWSGDAVVERTSTRAGLAWFSEKLSSITTHPSGRTWAGALSNYLCLFKLEGGG